MTQHSLIQQLEFDLKEQLDQVRTLIAPLPEAALRARPAMDKWNILECFAHLNALTEAYLPNIEASIHKAKARKWASQEMLRSTWAGRNAIQRVNPATLTNKKRKAHKRLNFSHQPIGPEEIKRFLILSERLMRNIGLAREVDLNQPKIKMAYRRFSTLNLGELFQYLVKHIQRHLIQIKNLAPAI